MADVKLKRRRVLSKRNMNIFSRIFKVVGASKAKTRTAVKTKLGKNIKHEIFIKPAPLMKTAIKLSQVNNVGDDLLKIWSVDSDLLEGFGCSTLPADCISTQAQEDRTIGPTMPIVPAHCSVMREVKTVEMIVKEVETRKNSRGDSVVENENTHCPEMPSAEVSGDGPRHHQEGRGRIDTLKRIFEPDTPINPKLLRGEPKVQTCP